MHNSPLAGTRVIEMSHMVMAPTCGLILAQLGAEVIKIEPLTGDKTRSLGGMGVSFFPLFNQGKKSVSLDIGTKLGRKALDRLLASADVFIENFTDGTMARLRLDSATLAHRYPHLIVGSHKGFLAGPYEHRPALDEVVQMMSGLAYMTGSRERPLRVGSSMNDIMGGMFGAIGVLAALIERSSSDKGKEIRVGLFENCLFAVAQHMVQSQITGVAPPPMPERIHAWPIYDIFETADGQRLFVGVTTEGSWRAFCQAFGFESFLGDPTLQTTTQRIEARRRIMPLVAAMLKKETAPELADRLEALGIAFAPINAPEDLFNDPHVQRPGGLVGITLPDGRVVKSPVLPLEMDRKSVTRPSSVPPLGAHTADVLIELGFSRKEIERLQLAQTA